MVSMKMKRMITTMDEARRTQIKWLVKNYYAQELLVGKLPSTLEEYLEGQYCTQDEIKYALEYAETVTKPLWGKSEQ